MTDTVGRRRISLVITDLDNTLYDWVGMWYLAFSAMLGKIVEISGLQQRQLETEIQQVYRRHGTAEYAFLIEELPSLREKHPGQELTVVYQEAVEAYRQARQAALQLYPGVLESLLTLKQRGCLLVAFTESRQFYTMRRLKKLDLDGVLDYVYSPPDHAVPTPLQRSYPQDEYRLLRTVHRFIPEGEQKPNPRILLEIIGDNGIQGSPDEAAYVGDNLMKDIVMAQEAGVADVYAAFGAVAQDAEIYEQLRRVSHWSREDVERDRAIYLSGAVVPNYRLAHSWWEIFDLFDFVPHNKHPIGM